MTPAEQAAAAKRRKPRKLKMPRPSRRYLWACTLREKRQSLGLSVHDVAKGVGMSSAGLFEIERGTDPQLTTARKLADFFGCSIEELWPKRRK